MFSPLCLPYNIIAPALPSLRFLAATPHRVRGCEVNDPGEAKEADIGLACGSDYAVIFRQGELIKRVKMTEAAQELLEETHALV